MNAIMKQRKQVALQDKQHQMQIMQDEFEKRFTEQNAKFQKCIEQMEHDNKENTDALSVDFEKRENEMREEIRIRDNKMKQADEMRLTTERIEKLFSSGIYSKQEDRKPLITALKSGPGYTPKGNLQDRSETRVGGPSALKRWNLPHIIRRQLQDLKQDQDDTPEEFVEILAMAIDAFMKGCLDKKAAVTAMDKNP
ncbi:unnamed protein product [Mytilus edulis]|uniref:Uncharacterized protein n=1 Tax=Mytilus edulis TaxID=6550 RepID=A0A8S3S8R5_MYTED|nr:unnamed protein product [Mytilus edulis]